MTPDAPPLYHTAMWSVPGETPLFLRPDNAENTDCTPRAFATTDPPDPESVEDILPTRRLSRRCPTGAFTNESHCASKSFLHAGISTLTLCSFSAPAEPSYLRRMLPNMPTRCNFPAISGARSNATARGCRADGNERHGLFCAADKRNHRRYAVFPECSRIPAHIAPGHPLFMRVTSAVVQDSRSDQDAVSKRRSFQKFFADRSAGNRVSCVGENHFQIPLVRLSQKHDRRPDVIDITAKSVCGITGWGHIALLHFLSDFKIVRKNANPVNLPRRPHTVCVFVPPFYFICSSVKSLNWISVSSAFGRNPSFARAERYSKAGCSSADGVRNTNSARFHSFEMGMLPFA